MSPLRRGKRVLTPRSFLVLLVLLVWHEAKRLLSSRLGRSGTSGTKNINGAEVPAAVAYAGTGVTKAMRERLMLVVTAVNGCHICRDYHSRRALELDVPEAEVRRLLAAYMGAEEGQLQLSHEPISNTREDSAAAHLAAHAAPPPSRPRRGRSPAAAGGGGGGGGVELSAAQRDIALAFAHSFAMHDGQFSAKERRRLEASLGARNAAAVITAVRTVTLGNLLGNTWESLAARLGYEQFGGSIAPHSSGASEAAVVLLLLLIPLGFLLLVSVLLHATVSTALVMGQRLCVFNVENK